MHEDGWLAPTTATEAREAYSDLAPTAQTVVRETAKAMAFDREEYGDRVTSDVIETALDALFASLLKVTVGTRGEFESVVEDSEFAVELEGSDEVDNVAWHVAPAGDTVVAATFHAEEEAAVGTLRRQAYGKVYRDILKEGDGSEESVEGAAS
ncbi:hypothetical protein DM867_02070 [Halosegnis rubeus]|jgi:hypothetical protein|uniref:Uncharacterized protein n=1 Tax=Halosegnis rubeus TaxID=2212850 RepID=A0A5N5UDQ2_9EURY|nr:DUF5809 family protein [Halosegnis rubeus]KAB7515951.1 hypothetical protein DM867_02070 [Halosegnis rubeus]KAB7516836.1 hypothetical protein DMP03_05580 [Halosegnis rubeus]KAB7520037.1 hypothetical protein DP108_01955 [Halosegnis rubeus]